MVKVLKFGGTSVYSSKNIQKTKDIIKRSIEGKEQLVVVISALGGVTNALAEAIEQARSQGVYKDIIKEIETRHFNIIRELIKIDGQSSIIGFVKRELNQVEVLLEGVNLLGESTLKTIDKILGYGEYLSSYILSEYLKEQHLDITFKDSRDYIITNSKFGQAKVDFKTTNTKILDLSEKVNNQVIVMPGFIASNSSGESTTLGRGGSDYTAAIVASALDATELQIWTDVSGMYTANPKLVKQAQPIPEISYEEAMELSFFGAKVVYPPTMQPVMNKNIPVLIKNTFDPEAKGTLITKGKKHIEHRFITGITHIQDVFLLTIEGSGMVGIVGISKRFFSVLSDEDINIALITQASSEHSICVAIDKKDAQKARKAIDKEFKIEMASHRIKPTVVTPSQAIIALVGEDMKNHQGLSGKMFSTLGRNNVNVVAIAQGSSERNISVVISEVDVQKAINALHEAFFQEDVKQLNLFVTGVGNVGQRFLEQIKTQSGYIKDHFRIGINVLAISNSRQMYFNEEGINLNTWQQDLKEKGELADVTLFHKKVKEYNKRNSVFVDNTANQSVSEIYEAYLKESISVVTCNKIACSSDYRNYKRLKEISVVRQASLLFETNVGAALPIIDTLKNLIASGDEITEIQAVLSGSLNFILNNFNEEMPFATIVKQAQTEGFTEPDPRIDLSGIDVARKMLILVRESGYKMNIEDIENTPFLPEKSLETDSVETFLESLEEEKGYFNSLYSETEEINCRLKYVASFKDGKAKVGIQKIPQDHPFYNLEGKDNIVLFFTKRYNEQPLIIKGAGAGADVTASGIFADIIRVGNLS